MHMHMFIQCNEEWRKSYWEQKQNKKNVMFPFCARVIYRLWVTITIYPIACALGLGPSGSGCVPSWVLRFATACVRVWACEVRLAGYCASHSYALLLLLRRQVFIYNASQFLDISVEDRKWVAIRRSTRNEISRQFTAQGTQECIVYRVQKACV